MKRTAIAFVAAIAATAATANDNGTASLGQAFSEMTSSLKGEFAKSALAKKAVSEGLAMYRGEQRVRSISATQMEKAKQTDLICNEVSSQFELSDKGTIARALVMDNQAVVASRFKNNTSTSAAMEQSFKSTSAKFCSEAEVAQGICKGAGAPTYAKLAGADQDAMYLFQSSDGAPTYEGARNGPQAQAVDSYISRVVYGPVPSEALSKATPYSSNRAARVYAEMRRRYASLLSMAAYSLQPDQERPHGSEVGTRNYEAHCTQTRSRRRNRSKHDASGSSCSARADVQRTCEHGSEGVRQQDDGQDGSGRGRRSHPSRCTDAR